MGIDREPETDAATVEYLCNMPPGAGYTGLSSFGIDDKSEVYMLKMGRTSKIYKLVTAESLAQSLEINFKLPQRLSQLHAFTDLAHLVAAPGIIPYGVNSPLWSDGATKQRWIAVPKNKQITITATDNFTFPAGTVFIKNFELTVNETNGASRRLETRFLVRDANGGVYGATYKWRNDNSDADLVPGPMTEKILKSRRPPGCALNRGIFPDRWIAWRATIRTPEAFSASMPGS